MSEFDKINRQETGTKNVPVSLLLRAFVFR